MDTATMGIVYPKDKSCGRIASELNKERFPPRGGSIFERP